MSEGRDEHQHSDHAPPEATLGRYELLSKFATGGMSELYLARERDAEDSERIVVKRLRPHLADRPDVVEGFLREGRIVASLNHPNIVQAHELDEDEGEYFIAMEYLHGTTLRELQQRTGDGGRLPVWFTVSAIEQVCRGLHAAHELEDSQGEPVELVHRDISPQNVMCTVDGDVKLLDFGVAARRNGDEAANADRAPGKYRYMSPEQLRQNVLDRRSDIFALGVVLWELCTGEPLFKGDTVPETIRRIVEDDPPPPRSARPGVPSVLDDVVGRALAKDPSKRFATAENLRETLVEAADAADLLRGRRELAEFVGSVVGDRR